MKTLLVFITMLIMAYGGFAQIIKVNNDAAIEKTNPIDNKGITIDFSKSTANPKNVEDYFNKGVEKYDVKDYIGAIAEFTKAIELNDLQFPEAYFNRGVAKFKLEDYKGAVIDYTKALENNPAYAKAYYNRGIAKIKLSEKESACLDLRKAEELGYVKANEYIKVYCK